MPAKIHPSLTNSSSGQISISDVHKMINDYITKVTIQSTDPTRNPVQKHYYFDVNLDRLRQVIDGSLGADETKIRINLVLNLPSQLNCDKTYSIEDYLSILVCAVSQENDSSLLREEDSVLVEGFKDFGEFAPDCCVQGHPPNN